MYDNNKFNFSKQLLQKLKQAVRLEEIVGKRYQLKKSGNNFYMNCPFCGKKEAFCISSQKQIGHCFVCGETIDVFGYFQKLKGLNFLQAVKEVKRIVNSNNLIELKKLSRASDCLQMLANGENPITKTTLISPALSDEVGDTILKVSEYIKFIIGDYFELNQCKHVSRQQLEKCKKHVELVLKSGFCEEDTNSREKLTNLFKFVLHVLNLIEQNNYNLGEIVHLQN